MDHSIHIIGCGNIFKGDDGIGSEVIKYLEEHYVIPDSVLIEDAGLACADWLLNLIGDPDAPKQVIVIDAQSASSNDPPIEIGEIFVRKGHELNLPDISINRHLFPDKTVVELLEQSGVDTTFITCQINEPSEEIIQGLSDLINSKISKIGDIVAEIVHLVSLKNN
ncbi:MAG: hydrogenase maturation protease [Candidatus Heimdallarchaeota archaeon]|nr:hydrogenase maturation protease [Candidatus Heimdallarchaeota archaeon]